VSSVVALPRALLDTLRVDVRAASWFAALGEPLTDGDRSDATAYAEALGFDFLEIGLAYPEAALWSALTDLTTDAGDLVHGKAATAAARLGSAAPASIHVAAGAASQAIYQLAVARLAGQSASPFESKFRLYAAGRWPLGILGSRLVLF